VEFCLTNDIHRIALVLPQLQMLPPEEWPTERKVTKPSWKGTLKFSVLKAWKKNRFFFFNFSIVFYFVFFHSHGKIGKNSKKHILVVYVLVSGFMRL